MLSEKQISSRLGQRYELPPIGEVRGKGGLSRDAKATRARIARKNKKKQRRG